MGKYEKVYFNDKDQKTWEGLKPEIKKQYGGVSKFFQHVVRAFDGTNRIEAKIKMKQVEKKQLEQELEILEQEIKGLKEKLENGEIDDIALSMDEDLQEHPKFSKAVRIVSRSIRNGDIRSPSSRSNVLSHWSNQLGVSKERMFELAVKHGDVSDSVLERVNA